MATRRGSVDRHHNRYGTPLIPRNDQWRTYNRQSLKYRPARLNRPRREAVQEAIRETCEIRKWLLWTQNIRSNHVHTVVSAACSPDKVLNALKANATRKMRERGCWINAGRPWVRGGSKRRLWTDQDIANAVAYVDYDQGEPLT
jgi:REP element-mobilizing transposase RayT